MSRRFLENSYKTFSRFECKIIFTSRWPSWSQSPIGKNIYTSINFRLSMIKLLRRRMFNKIIFFGWQQFFILQLFSSFHQANCDHFLTPTKLVAICCSGRELAKLFVQESLPFLCRGSSCPVGLPTKKKLLSLEEDSWRICWKEKNKIIPQTFSNFSFFFTTKLIISLTIHTLCRRILEMVKINLPNGLYSSF